MVEGTIYVAELNSVLTIDCGKNSMSNAENATKFFGRDGY